MTPRRRCTLLALFYGGAKFVLGPGPACSAPRPVNPVADSSSRSAGELHGRMRKLPYEGSKQRDRNCPENQSDDDPAPDPSLLRWCVGFVHDGSLLDLLEVSDKEQSAGCEPTGLLTRGY